MLTEEVNPRTRDIDSLPTLDVLRLINEEDATVARAVRLVLEPVSRVIDRVSELLQSGGGLYYVGAGTSGRLGLMEAMTCASAFGTDPGLVQGILAGGVRGATQPLERLADSRSAGAGDVEAAGVSGRDAVIIVTASGRTPYALGAAEQAAQTGAFTASVSCNPNAEISQLVVTGIEVLCGPEVLSGMTCLKAATAQKMILNMITTATMIRLGNVYSNLLVNLPLVNSQLIERGIRAVSIATGASFDEAQASLKATGDVRSAIVMLSLQCTPDEARGLVSQSARLNQIIKDGRSRHS